MENGLKNTKEVGVPSWEQFVQAVDVFKNDYAIVGHGGELRTEMFGMLRPHMEYSVTGLELDSMSQGEFNAKLQEKPVVLLIECMDKRGANLTRAQVANALLPELGIKADEVNILTLAMGGGIIQRDVVTQEGKQVEVNRGQAMKTILQYLEAKAGVAKVISTDHNHGCGAEAFAADGRGWPEQLGVAPGAEEENNQMKKLIQEYSVSLLPPSWQEAGLVEQYLVKFSDDPENDPRVELEKI